MPTVLKALVWIAIGAVVIDLGLSVVYGGVSLMTLLENLVAVGAAIVAPIWLGRRRLIFMVAWLAAYVISYGVLSWQGGYIGCNLGGNDNRDIWYPALCGEAYWSRSGRQHSVLLPLGWFFLPLVLADRCLIHPTQFDC